MAWTQTDLDDIEEAIALGALSVKHGDKTVTYRSVQEMREVKQMIERSLTSPKPPHVAIIALKSGL